MRISLPEVQAFVFGIGAILTPIFIQKTKDRAEERKDRLARADAARKEAADKEAAFQKQINEMQDRLHAQEVSWRERLDAKEREYVQLREKYFSVLKDTAPNSHKANIHKEREQP